MGLMGEMDSDTIVIMEEMYQKHLLDHTLGSMLDLLHLSIHFLIYFLK